MMSEDAVARTSVPIDTDVRVRAATEAKRHDVTTIVLTGAAGSPITAVADLVLTTAGRETIFRSGATASRIAQLTVVDCVFVAVVQRSYDATLRALAATRDAVSGRQPRPQRRRGYAG
jgi:DNA-binding MurR/RpiR family transcriptional regulator